MSNDLTTIQNSLPAELRAQLAEQVTEEIGRIGSVGGKDSIRVTQDKKFEMPNGDQVDEITGVVVDFIYRNEYYLGAYNRKVITPPACFALSNAAADMVPSDNSPMKQSSFCASCQQNQFGSDAQGSGKACKNTVFMAVLPTDATPDTPLFVIKTSPTAVKHFNSYVTKVARTAKVPVYAVATRIYFDPSSSYASLRFDIDGANPIFGQVMERRDEARHRLMQEPDVSTFEMPTSKR